jgi:hypothetical protein
LYCIARVAQLENSEVYGSMNLDRIYSGDIGENSVLVIAINNGADFETVSRRV